MDYTAEIVTKVYETEINGNVYNFNVSDIEGDVNFNGFKIENLGQPESDNDAATKKYVDDLPLIAERFAYSQDAASASWTINHNLSVYPEVKVLDSANTEIIGDVIYLSLDSIRIDFSAPFSGKAYLI
jgi:hypothetical protein